MNPTKNPFDHMLDAFREIVREELTALKPAEPPKLLLDTEEAAKFLNVPPTWLASTAREGKIKSIKLGHYVRFARTDLEAFIVQVKDQGRKERSQKCPD